MSKKLQKEVERVRKKGYLEVTIRFDAKKYLEKPDFTSFSTKCWEEGKVLFLFAFKILEAYRKKYG
jgi:hypothetical protein